MTARPGPAPGPPPLDRSRFPVTERLAYLNHATICAPPTPVIEAANAFNAHAARSGGVGFLDRVASVRPARHRLAGLLGADPAGLAFTKNTTEALSWLTHALPWSPGDRALVPAHDFPSTRLPVLALRPRGVVVDEVAPVGQSGEVPLEVWERALRAGPTRLVVTSWVQSTAGWRTDPAALGRLCHEHGALLCLDVIQGLGVLPVDVAAWGADAVVGGSHKWLLATEGCGFLWIAPTLIDGLSVPEPGWRWMGTEATDKAFSLPPEAGGADASRFEGGTLNGAGLAGLLAAVDLLQEIGDEAVWAHVDGLCDHLCAGLADLGVAIVTDRSPSARSAIVAFRPGDLDADAVVAHLGSAGIAVSARSGAVRVSPHGFNTGEEIERLLRMVGELIGQTGRP